MITFTPAGVAVPVDGILNGARSNDMGHGYAVATGTQLHVGKSMDGPALLDDYRRLMEEPGSVGLFHSRWATHGDVNTENAHPFRVGDARTVMAHNGVLPKRWLPGKGDPRTDSQVLADGLAGMMGPLGVPGKTLGRRLGQEIGGGNKLVFLSVAGGFPKARIVNAGSGEWVAGSWFSNGGHRPRLVTPSWLAGSWDPVGNRWLDDDDAAVAFGAPPLTYGRPPARDWHDDDAGDMVADDGWPMCVTCGRDGVTSLDEPCMVCKACQACGEDWTFDQECDWRLDRDGYPTLAPAGDLLDWGTAA